MTYYDQLRVSSNATAEEIWFAGEQSLAAVTKENIRNDLVKNTPNTMEQANVLAEQLVPTCRAHISRIIQILTEPGARDCYDAWLNASTMEQKQLTNARIQWYNANRQEHQVGFSKDFLFEGYSAPTTSNIKVVPSNTKECREILCRYCRTTVNEDPPHIIKCHCTARIGHRKCGNEFLSTYENKCPICRENLCIRKDVSKYLFWNTDSRWSI